MILNFEKKEKAKMNQGYNFRSQEKKNKIHQMKAGGWVLIKIEAYTDSLENKGRVEMKPEVGI